MTRGDLSELAPWIEAGVNVSYAGEKEPHRLLLAKGYLREVENGYALTKRGERQAGYWKERDERGKEHADRREPPL